MRRVKEVIAAMPRLFAPLLLLVGLVIATGGPVLALVPNTLRDMVDAGEVMPFEAIRNRIVAQVHGDYVGAEFDASTKRYRFRFVIEGNVVNIDVDARTGQRLSRQSF
jgi:hypothetical protein